MWPEITVRLDHRRTVPGVLVHRSRTLGEADVSRFDGIPVTTVPRTLVDLASLLDLADLSRACHEAHVRHRTDPRVVEAAMCRAPRSPGIVALRQALRGDDLVLSDLEAGFLAALRGAGLPAPRTNRLAAAGRVDCRWPERGLVVELDLYRFHATRRQWEEDVRRDRRTRLAGEAPLRFTWGDVFERPGAMLAELRELLT